MARRRFVIPHLRPRREPVPVRRFSAKGLRAIERIGFTGAGWRDLYHGLMTMPMAALLAALAATYLASNLVFTGFYLLLGNGIGHARHGSFFDAFFFSVQTMATISYGQMFPQTLAANLVATAETVYGLLAVTIASGIFFSRFSRPTARVLFSRVCVVTPYNGVPTLMFRVANQRRNQIVEAQMSLAILRAEVSAEGLVMRRFQDLRLIRSRSMLFALTWTVMHPIDADSPLYGLGSEGVKAEDVELICSLTGIDDTFSQPVHARHVYGAEELRWAARFVDITGRTPDGRAYIDYTRFHDVMP
jgi:inward rectifier potassium channel